MNNHGIIVLISCIIIMMGLVVRLLYDLYHIPEIKPPRKAICVKCKYCVKTRWWHARIKKISCRTPKDQMETNYLTGKVRKLKFSCDLRNAHGQCSEYKRRWLW